MSSAARIRHLRGALADRLERLRQTLEELITRVHEAVAQAVSQAVSAAVRDAILAVLRAATNCPGLPTPPWTPPKCYHSAWSEGRESSSNVSTYADPSAGWWTEEEADDDEVDRPEPIGVEPPPSRWRCALALGCRATGWSLRRWPGRRPLLAAVVVGAACAAVAYATGAGLAHTTLCSIALAGALASGICALSRGQQHVTVR
jgi:hypothetical protein